MRMLCQTIKIIVAFLLVGEVCLSLLTFVPSGFPFPPLHEFVFSCFLFLFPFYSAPNGCGG
jgi:hypothetical protein